MTITLERPRAQAAYFDTNRVLPACAADSETSRSTPSATARTRTALPAGGRLVRQRTGEAPTLSLSRKLKMLAPAALLAGVSAGGVAVAPHLASLLDGLGEQFANAAATVTQDQVVEQHAAPKHRATSPDVPDVIPAPRHHPAYQPKHRATNPADASRPGTEPATEPATGTPATAPAGTGPTGGSHAADHPSTAATTTTAGGKHRGPSADQASTGDQADASPTKQDAAPPADQSPSSDSPSSGSSTGPVTGLVTTVDDTVKGVTGLAGLG